MGPWSLYVAIVVVSIGLYVYLSAPPGSLFWLMAAIAVALLAQSAAAQVMSASHSGFVGAFLSVPFAMLAARIKTSPPAIVMMLAAFWSLVPGALSFVAVGEVAAGEPRTRRTPRAWPPPVRRSCRSRWGPWWAGAIFHTIDSRLPWSKEVGYQR